MNPTELSDIIAGYQRGLFLMADEDSGQLSWYGTRWRTLIPLDERFRYPRSLRRVLHRRVFTPRINGDFAAVVQGCADRPQTWISPELSRIYLALHQQGWAYSFETWQGTELAAGILGIVLGGVFIGESMFFRVPDASKVAMVLLVEHLRRRGFALFDAQLMNAHLARFGAVEIPHDLYQQHLEYALTLPCQFWDPDLMG
ncbi:MAG: leucyl/phenylalanyl-tRNA--protein transferase [Synechococcales cyanobacterium]